MGEEGGGRPLDLRVVEGARRGLVQLDVSLRPKQSRNLGGPSPIIQPDDLELLVNGERIELNYLDRVCRPTAAESINSAVVDAGDVAVESADVLASRATYVFYLEHTLLTQAGLNRALEMIDALVPSLVRDGSHGIVVSSGQRLLQSEWTADVGRLGEFLKAVRTTPAQWTEYVWAETELTRMADVAGGTTAAQRESRARLYKLQDVQLTRNRLLRLAGTLGVLTDRDPPRVVLYFADAMRRNAGQPYEDVVGPVSGSPFDAADAFDRVTESAAALGVRIYTIHAQGMTSPHGAAGVGANVVRKRIQYAQDSMATLALETGGMIFREAGASLERIQDRLESDLGCMFLLSFEPGKLPRDRPLPVRLRFDTGSPLGAALAERYEPAARGQIVVTSEARRKEAVLLAAHLATNSSDTAAARAGVIPLGFRDGRFLGLVQIAVANPDLPEEAMSAVGWELGLTAIRKDTVGRQVSGNIAVPASRAAIVLEAEWSFLPGTTKFIGVASETGLGSVASAEFDVEWPNLGRELVSLSHIAVAQPISGGFLHKSQDDAESTRVEGTLVGGTRLPARRPTELISLVCTGEARSQREFWIERRLVGPSSGEFETRHWLPAQDERCVQIRDQIPAAGILPGMFRYELRVRTSSDSESRAVAEGSTEFEVFDVAVPMPQH